MSTARIVRVLLVVLAIAAVTIGPELASRFERPGPQENLAATAEVSTKNVMGVVRWLHNGPLYPEGASWQQERAVVLADRVGEVRLDFGGVVPVAALILQARHDGRFAFEVSLDGESWIPIWSVRAVDEPGLRTWRQALATPPHARYVRLVNPHARSGSLSAVTAIRVYSEVPAGWPDPPSASVGDPVRSFPWLSPSDIVFAKVVLAWLGAVLLVLSFVLDRTGVGAGAKRLTEIALLAVALLAGVGWLNFFQPSYDDHERTTRNFSDVFHYYLASKYHAELDYTGLYACHLAADVEDGFRSLHLKRRITRDLATNQLVPTSVALTAAARCHERFSPARWEEFRSENAWFRARLQPSQWLQLARDHGYNASPAWTLSGAAVANLVDMTDDGFFLLVSLDKALLVLMWVMAFGAFGWRAAAAALLFWGTNLVSNDHTFSVGAFLRQDWLFFSVAGLCCLKRGWPALAGLLLVEAALLRIFPMCLLGGVGLAILGGMLKERRFVLSGEHRRLIVGAAIGLVVIVSASVVGSGRTAVWSEFLETISEHQQTVQLQNIGLAALVLHVDDQELRDRERITIDDIERSYRQHPQRRMIARVVALLLLPFVMVAAVNRESWVAALLGLAWLPFATDMNNYYSPILLAFGFLLVCRPVVSLGFAALTACFASLGFTFGYLGLALYTWASLAFVAFCAWVLVLFTAPNLVRAWKRARGHSTAVASSS